MSENVVELDWWIPWDGLDHSVDSCRVYWGTHGCTLSKGHSGPHRCDCWDEPEEEDVLNVGAWPYYGPETHFYGEDVKGDEYLLGST